MDVLTPKGQRSRWHEDRAVKIWLHHFPTYSYVETPKDKPAVVDAVLSVNNSIKAVVETKCRNITLFDLQGKFNNEWLMTHDKMIKGSEIASALSVPFIGFLYLIQDEILMYQKLWEPEVGWVCSMAIRPTWTQATINGGKALRSNAFIDMSKATQLRKG